jgi:hypothetical protein
MIEFEEREGSSIPPEATEASLPSKEDVQKFFESYFKKNVDDYLIYKKNQFKSPSTDVIPDFFSKLEAFIKSQAPEDKQNVVTLIFKNIQNDIKMLEETSTLPSNDKMKAFVFSFLVSKFFS